MANNQDYTEDMAQGDFSNESSYGDFQQTEAQTVPEPAEANGNEAMEEATNGDNGHDSASQSHGKRRRSLCRDLDDEDIEDDPDPVESIHASGRMDSSADDQK